MCFRAAVLVFLFGVMWPGLPRPLLLAQVEAPQYVGSDACQACHEELAIKVAETAHGKLAQEKEPKRQGCEACHGPGSNHVNSGGDKSLLFTFRDASRVAVARQCGVCHQASPTPAQYTNTALPVAWPAMRSIITGRRNFCWWKPSPSFAPIATTGCRLATKRTTD